MSVTLYIYSSVHKKHNFRGTHFTIQTLLLAAMAWEGKQNLQTFYDPVSQRNNNPGISPMLQNIQVSIPSCSVLIKEVADNIIVSHATWHEYRAMPFRCIAVQNSYSQHSSRYCDSTELCSSGTLQYSIVTDNIVVGTAIWQKYRAMQFRYIAVQYSYRQLSSRYCNCTELCHMQVYAIQVHCSTGLCFSGTYIVVQ